jgi:hypothetical protein
MKSMVFSQDAINRRLPLWIALADLFLDTEDPLFVTHVAEVANRNGFETSEVDAILRWEVRPALYHNLLSVAGEWAGWEDDWLRDHMVRSIRARHWLCTWPFTCLCKNWFMPEEWHAIQAAMASAADLSVSSIQPPPSTRSPS